MDPAVIMDNLEFANNSEMVSLTENQFGILDCCFFPKHDDFLHTIANSFADSYPGGEHIKQWPLTFDYKKLQRDELNIYHSRYGQPEVLGAKLR